MLIWIKLGTKDHRNNHVTWMRPLGSFKSRNYWFIAKVKKGPGYWQILETYPTIFRKFEFFWCWLRPISGKLIHTNFMSTSSVFISCHETCWFLETLSILSRWTGWVFPQFVNILDLLNSLFGWVFQKSIYLRPQKFAIKG